MFKAFFKGFLSLFVLRPFLRDSHLFVKAFLREHVGEGKGKGLKRLLKAFEKAVQGF